jgi:hypothetical protein
MPKYESYDSLTLPEVGISRLTQVFFFGICFLPVAGILIGGYYSVQGHRPTRQFGRTMLSLTILMHVAYTCFICPALLYLTLT